MKQLHRPDLFAWSAFDEARNLDFNGFAWARKDGNVLIDPMPMSAHDLEHLRSLGGAALIVVTNSDHTRLAHELQGVFGAKLLGPVAEKGAFAADRWIADGEEIVPGLVALEMQGSKTPGELALLLEETTLITGDLIRGHRGGALNLLPDEKLSDKEAAIESVRRILENDAIDAVLVGDGWPIFYDGHAKLGELVDQGG